MRDDSGERSPDGEYSGEHMRPQSQGPPWQPGAVFSQESHNRVLPQGSRLVPPANRCPGAFNLQMQAA